MYRYLFILLFLFAGTNAWAQKMPERGLVRKGNRQFEKGEYEQSILRYSEALEAAPGNFEATFNLGNGLYRAGQFDKAGQALQAAAADTLRTEAERAEAFYDLGNAQFQQKKYQEALESYKQSLRLNPADQEAKFNYAYTKYLLDQQKNDQNKDQNKDQQKDQNKEQQKDDQNKDQNKDQKQDQQDDKPQDQNQQQQPSEGEISKQEQERMLDAIQAQEDRTQEKLKEKQGVVVRGRKNW